MTELAVSAAPRLIALDWGTSSLRAFLLGDGAQVLAQCQADCGILHLPAPGGRQGFERAFADVAGAWLAQWPRLPVVAGGMVGSAQGWREAPYVRCPADVVALASQATRVAAAPDVELWIAPGVLFDPGDAPPDVMRGEEIQIAGALVKQPAWNTRACFVLPGTHSKWAVVESGRLLRFSTYMTGEFYAIARQHSILGRLLPAADPVPSFDAARDAAFDAALDAARASRPGELTHQLFAVRTLGLTDRLPREALADYLSGLLIGHELASGLAESANARAAGAPIVLIGEPALCRRYARALQRFGAAPAAQLDNTAPLGLWAFAQAAGLLTAA
jgi:2-dehydro-3-deoxygalactonokinase